MKQNKLTILIDKPAQDVYAFYIDPKNTPLWLPFVAEETTNIWPVKVGTVYRNINKSGKVTLYTVTSLKENEMFELADGHYHVRYSQKIIDTEHSELEYFEWMEAGELEEPFTMDLLLNLKKVLGNKS